VAMARLSKVAACAQQVIRAPSGSGAHCYNYATCCGFMLICWGGFTVVPALVRCWAQVRQEGPRLAAITPWWGSELSEIRSAVARPTVIPWWGGVGL